MAVEHFNFQILEARASLSASLISQLSELQTSETKGTFSFKHYVGEQPKDTRSMRFLARFRQGLSYPRRTWYKIEYSDGQLQTVKMQNVDLGKPTREIPGSKQEITLGEIPFKDFSARINSSRLSNRINFLILPSVNT